MAAFTRIATAPIWERGAIARPDLVVVADETLLTKPAAQPLAGCEHGSTLLLNSTRDERTLREMMTYSGRLLVADFTMLALTMTHTLAGLSTALGVTASALVGLGVEATMTGLEDELREAHLTPAQQTANLDLGRTVYARARPWQPVRARDVDAAIPPIPLVEVTFAPPAQAAPSIYAIANSPQRQTGSWRQFRPVLHRKHCTRCWLCFVWCPEAAIALDAEDYPVVAVIDKNLAPGLGGITYQEIAAALYATAHRPPLLSVVGGLGGKDISDAEFDAVGHDLQRAAAGERLVGPCLLYTQPEQERMQTLLRIAGKEIAV